MDQSMKRSVMEQLEIKVKDFEGCTLRVRNEFPNERETSMDPELSLHKDGQTSQDVQPRIERGAL